MFKFTDVTASHVYQRADCSAPLQPSGGASVNEYMSVFKTRLSMKPVITLFLAVVQPPYFKLPGTR